MARALRLKAHQLIDVGGGTKLAWMGEGVLEEVEKKIHEKNKEFAEKIAARARLNAPSRTGTLAKSITVVEIKKGSKFFFTNTKHWGVVAKGATGGIGQIRYASFVELGTQKTLRQPYVWPAFNSMKPQWVEDMKGIIGK